MPSETYFSSSARTSPGHCKFAGGLALVEAIITVQTIRQRSKESILLSMQRAQIAKPLDHPLE